MNRLHSTTHSPSSLCTHRLCLLDCYQFHFPFPLEAHLCRHASSNPSSCLRPFAWGFATLPSLSSILTFPSLLGQSHLHANTCNYFSYVSKTKKPFFPSHWPCLLLCSPSQQRSLKSWPYLLLNFSPVPSLAFSLKLLKDVVKSHSWTASLWYLTDQQHLIELVTASFPPFLHLAFGQPCFLEFLFT